LSPVMVHAPALGGIAFGDRYVLLRQLAVGGMAEIYLARQNAAAGFEKLVVIKRLKPELAGDTRIVEMFLDEARIGAVLNHPNIVHVYDVDEHEGIPYIAMEYIVGEELNVLARRGLGLGKFLPLEHAVELMRQAAAGMGYFHHMRRDHRGAGGAGGEAMDIVHLDISPTNLLVTEDGFLKIIDFGIARAKGQKFRDEGSIPGKLSYMSPEQAARGRVDHRSDIFSLGIVLYEITVGRRLFKGPAAEVVKRLLDAKVEPPTFAKREFPGALESVVMRCLEKHPADRYQSAYDLADDLEEFLRSARLHSGPVRIARYLDELVTAAGGQRRPELVSEAEQADRDELDFDSKVFDAYRAAEVQEGESEAAKEWDEYEEGDEGLAEALGMDLDQLRQMRTPVPESAPHAAPVMPLQAPASTPVAVPPEPARATSEPPESGPVTVTATATGTVKVVPAPRETAPREAVQAPARDDAAAAVAKIDPGLMAKPGISPVAIAAAVATTFLVLLLYWLL
jgi:eukaryotic-like serine/threonine-protein kinase